MPACTWSRLDNSQINYSVFTNIGDSGKGMWGAEAATQFERPDVSRTHQALNAKRPPAFARIREILPPDGSESPEDHLFHPLNEPDPNRFSESKWFPLLLLQKIRRSYITARAWAAPIHWWLLLKLVLLVIPSMRPNFSSRSCTVNSTIRPNASSRIRTLQQWRQVTLQRRRLLQSLTPWLLLSNRKGLRVKHGPTTT